MRTIPCPTCSRPVQWTEASSWRPFCSERCKLIDLGAWAAEKHSIPGEKIEQDEQDEDDEDGFPPARE